MGLRKKRGGKPAEKRQEVDDYQPKLLKKPEVPKIIITSPENVENKEENVEVTKVRQGSMKHSVLIINKNYVDSDLIFENLELENANFYVVGVIGMKDSGKSTLLNLIATGELHRCKDDKKSSLQAPLFSDFPSGNGIEGFITEKRLILLDSAPVMHNIRKREFIMSEADDIRQVQSLLQLSHELLIVYESSQILNLVRMLLCAHNMLIINDWKMPRITLVENRVRCKSAKHPITGLAVDILLKSKISDSINCIQLPDFNLVATDEDPMETVNKLRDKINDRKEVKAQESSSETEKTWFEKLSKMKMDGGLLLTEFENMREKFIQTNEH